MPELTEQIIGAAIEVHRELGPGLLESAYQRALAHELDPRNIPFEQPLRCPVNYKDLVIEDAYRWEFKVGGSVVLELKTVDQLMDVLTAQVLTYLKFSVRRIGLLMNFRATILTRGLKRFAL